jgi:hypothetical protein
MMKTFLTPTIVHFCTIVFVCLSVTVPSLTLTTLGGLWALANLIGVAYSCGVWVRIRRRYGSVTSFCGPALVCANSDRSLLSFGSGCLCVANALFHTS